jgi:hypothetical protein
MVGFAPVLVRRQFDKEHVVQVGHVKLVRAGSRITVCNPV